MYIAGFANTSNRGAYVLSIFTCAVFIVCGALFLANYPKKLSHTATFEGLLVELNSTRYSMKIKGAWHYGGYVGNIQKTYNFTKDDLPNICYYVENSKSDSVRVRIWAEKKQARQIEMNGAIVKKYDWWKYAQPALWLMILPGTIILILLILDRKRLLKEPEQEKSA